MFLTIEPVEIFDQFLFFSFRNLQNVSFGKFLGVVGNRLVYSFGFYTIQFRNIGVDDYLLTAQGDDSVFYFDNVCHIVSVCFNINKYVAKI